MTDQVDSASLKDESPEEFIENVPIAEPGYSDVNDKRLVRKLDKRIVPFLSLLYLLSFLDRTNIGNARLFGLETDLGFTGTQYSTCLAIFFVGYVAFEIPSNMALKRTRPSIWLPIIMLAWGLTMTFMGFVKNFQDLMISRVILGITEAGLFPGVSWFITLWYKRAECAFRISLFFAAASMAGAFGGLLARLINLMDDVAGLDGWRWIFILEGILTVLVAVSASCICSYALETLNTEAGANFWMLEDFPETSKFLSEEEKRRVIARLAEDSVGLSTEWKKRFIYDGLLDWKVWLQGLLFIAGLMPVYSFSLFMPTIVANMGFTAATSQLLTVPPYVCGGLSTIFAGWISDRKQQRYWTIVILYCVGIVGFVMLISSVNPAFQYPGVFLGAIGIYPQIPLDVSFAGNNMGGVLKRGVGMAFVVGFGNMGGVISSYIYRAPDKPHYYLGHGTIIGFLCMGVVSSTILRLYMGRQNRLRDEADGGKQWTPEERAPYVDDGDDAPFFRYML